MATYFTLIESAKANGVEPLAYLPQVFANIAAADTVSRPVSRRVPA